MNTATEARILIVDDDAEIRTLLAGFLERHGYAADTAADADDARRRIAREHYDLIVLDIMMPGEDGLSLCRSLRAESRTPIVMLTAIAEETDRIVGLEMGADDYLTKPFNPRELLARIRAIFRRVRDPLPVHDDLDREVLEFEGWRLDPGRRELTDPSGTLVPLTAGEFDLLVAFTRRPQRVLTRDQLLDYTAGRSAGPFDRSIDVRLSRLRQKIEANPRSPVLIRTIRGGGYLFAAPVTRRPGQTTK